MGSQKEPTSDSFCLGPRPYNRKLKAKYVLRLEFSCHKAKLYEAASNEFFVFHPNSTNSTKTSIYQSLASGSTGERSRKAHSAVATEQLGFYLQVINSVRGGWKIAVKFSKPVAEISSINKARFEGRSQDRRTFHIKNVSGQIQNANLKQCERINIEFAGKLVSSPANKKLVSSSANKPLSAFVLFERKEPEYAEINPPRGLSDIFPTWGELLDNRSHLNPKTIVLSNEVNLIGEN